MAREPENRGYVDRIDSKLSLRSPDGILEDWVRSYDLKRNQLSGYFCMAESVPCHRYLFRDSQREPIFTGNIDLMVSPMVPVIGHKTIDRALLDAGLKNHVQD